MPAENKENRPSGPAVDDRPSRLRLFQARIAPARVAKAAMPQIEIVMELVVIE